MRTDLFAIMHVGTSAKDELEDGQKGCPRGLAIGDLAKNMAFKSILSHVIKVPSGNTKSTLKQNMSTYGGHSVRHG